MDGKYRGEHKPHDRSECGQYHHGRYHARKRVHLSEQDERRGFGVCEVAREVDVDAGAGYADHKCFLEQNIR